MTIKPNAQNVIIKEQIIEDKVSELTFLFESTPGGARLCIIGDNLPFGNRDFFFNVSGELAGTGTAVGGSCKASWLKEIK